MVENGKSLAMYELQIGDKVQTGKQISLSDKCYLDKIIKFLFH